LKVLIAAGEFFNDFIFYGIRRLPRMGEELVTRNFAITLGGGAPNTAITAARLGRRVELATVLGDSVVDELAIARLEKEGVGCRLVKRRPNGAGAVTVAVSGRKDRFFLTYPGSNQFLQSYLVAQNTRRKLAEGEHVHFGLAPENWSSFSKLVGWLRRQNVTTSWDLGWHPEALGEPGFRELYSKLDIVFLNKLEALRLSRSKTVRDALGRLARPGQCVVVKLGPSGAIASDSQAGFVRVRGRKANVVDTTGAGDAFNGGFLHTWLNGRSLEECLTVGNICGSLSTTKPGGADGTPTSKQLERLLEARS
jgi:ribokinase